MAIVTLLTDFGTRDAYVGEVKGVLLSASPSVRLVDLSHDIPPGNIAAAAYILDRCRRRFPPGTIHLVVVDPGVGTSRAALALAAHDQFFVGPDNGLFTRVLQGAESSAVTLAPRVGAAPTFHGRDLFAPAAAHLANGRPLQLLGPPLAAFPQRLILPQATVDAVGVTGVVIYQDRFGTLVTNIPAELVPADPTVLVAGRDVGGVRRTFGDVPPGAPLALVGSDGTIEIAVRDGSAADRLGAAVGDTVRVAGRREDR